MAESLMLYVCLLFSIFPSPAPGMPVTLMEVGSVDPIFQLLDNSFVHNQSLLLQCLHLDDQGHAFVHPAEQCIQRDTVNLQSRAPLIEAHLANKLFLDSLTNCTLQPFLLQQNCLKLNQVLTQLTEGEDPVILINYIPCIIMNHQLYLLGESASATPEVLFLNEFSSSQTTISNSAEKVLSFIHYTTVNNWPLLLTIPSSLDLYLGAITFLHKMGWRRIAVVTSPQMATSSNIVELLRKWLTLRAPTSGRYSENATSLEYDRYMSIINSMQVETVTYDHPKMAVEGLYWREMRIIVFFGGVCDYFDILIEAHKLSFYGKGFVWMIGNFNFDFPNQYNLDGLLRYYSSEDLGRLTEVLSGTLTFGLSSGHGTGYHGYSEALKEHLKTNLDPLPQSAYSRDTVLFLREVIISIAQIKSQSLNVPLESVSLAPQDIQEHWHEVINNVTAHGLTGPISFTSNGIRTSATFIVKNFVPADLEAECNYTRSLFTNQSLVGLRVESRALVSLLPHEPNLLFYDCSDQPSNYSNLVFGNLEKTPPPDHPGRLPPSDPWLRVGLVGGYFLLCATVSVLYIWSVHRQDSRALLYDNSWIYSMEDIDFERKSGFWSTVGGDASKGKSEVSWNKCSTFGKLHGKLVYLKKANINDLREISLQTRAKILQLKELKHPNVCTFFGCIIEPSFSATVTEHCSKGSLTEILYDKSIQLNWFFLINFALDASRGLSYLHSKKFIHGNLSPDTCVIDSRWTLKLTDISSYFTVPQSRMQSTTSVHSIYQKMGGIRSRSKRGLYNYEAPEVKLLGSPPSYSADMYSLGQILLALSSVKNLRKKISRDILPTNNIDKETPLEMTLVIKACTSGNPSSRPSSAVVKRSLAKLETKGTVTKGENVLSLLEAYSKYLEEVVKEKSTHLEMEEQRRNRDLYRFVPENLVELMLKGIIINPEEFEKASVLVIEFTSSTQNQNSLASAIVDGIHSIQQRFDAVIRSYRVHRLTQASSSYVAASGVHNHKGVESVEELAQLSQQLFLEASKEEKSVVDIKMGLATGPLMCGVVGQGIPVYMAHGPALETASLLAATGEVGAVHTIRDVVECLKKSPVYLSSPSGSKVKLSSSEEVGGYLVHTSSKTKRRLSRLPLVKPLSTATLTVPSISICDVDSQ